MHRSILIAPAVLAAGIAVAQEPQRPEPTDPRAKVPALEYRSAFEGYRPFAEEKVAPWRESNEAVKEGGGHEGHGAPPAGTPKQAEKPKPPAADQHRGHR